MNSYITSFHYNPEIQCPQCKTDKFLTTDFTRADNVCTNCGIVVQSKMINDGADWNNYTSGINNSRCSGIEDINPYSSCGSFIKPGSKLWIGMKDGKNIYTDLYKLHIRTTYSSKQRSFDVVAKIFKELRDNQKGVPEVVINSSQRFWGAIMDKGIQRGANRKGIIASCVLYACYENKCAMTRKEIGELLVIKREDITKGEPIFCEKIKGTKYEYILKFSSNIYEMFERKIGKFVNLQYKYVKRCMEIYQICEKELVNMKPDSIIGGIITYIIKDENKIKKPTIGEICKTMDISNPTLNKSRNFIKELMNTV